MRLILLLLLAACSTLSLQGVEPQFRLEPQPPPSRPPAGPAWHTTFDEAEAAARQDHVATLIYFTANW